MTLNYIWLGFFLTALLVGVVKLLGGDASAFAAMTQATFDSAKTGFDISIGLTGVLTLWLGLMKVGEAGGAIGVVAKIVSPFFRRLFPEVPPDHPALGSIIMNFSANMLGLDNAATPLGLKAMNELQTLNPEKDTATNAQIMFLVLNTSGLTLIPISIMVYRAELGAANPADVFLPILITTYFATLAALVGVALVQRINLLDPVLLGWLVGVTALVSAIVWGFSSMPREQVQIISNTVANVTLIGVICSFLIMALVRKVNAYEAFIEGAKEGFQVAIRIIPYLVALLVAIGVFRASGALDLLTQGLAKVLALFGVDDRIIPALPTALMKPLSGSGARGMMVDAMKTYGADSFAGRLSATFQGATDTTFYILALYFGSVGVKKTRHAVSMGLFADIVGVIVAIVMAYLYWG
ncbi:nucleoside recognition domain-containing protein [Gemmatimonas sp. UBA7669]|uniref:nucleoside recognition domain-containing protein n=1 Tax=Gemmatimonas sp. UBA7669 TaxID=1946568 RepID=UPI0025B81A4A|nr:spore maturation protein [Gemmatimonas sp. UBA7669]